MQDKLNNYADGFFDKGVIEYDPELGQSLEKELSRQKNQIEILYALKVLPLYKGILIE